jgi:hypothetical protein
MLEAKLAPAILQLHFCKLFRKNYLPPRTKKQAEGGSSDFGLRNLSPPRTFSGQALLFSRSFL